MDSAGQQKILGYFIEEAKEHLETIEQGILELSSVNQDMERLNEMFRAAHSIKGGAAMLGYTSIQKTAHRLEDAFKILKEQEVKVDRNLESLFFKVYDALQELIDLLQGPFGLRDEDAHKITQTAEPNFIQLQNYLNELVNGGGEEVQTQEIAASVTPPQASEKLSSQIRVILKQMLQLFKQKSTPASRQKLQKICFRLSKLAPQEKTWEKLAKTAYRAIANPKHSYAILAPVVIQDLKIGSDLLCLNRAEEISPSATLVKLASSKCPQIVMPVEPKAAAKLLRENFNKKQLSQIFSLIKSS